MMDCNLTLLSVSSIVLYNWLGATDVISVQICTAVYVCVCEMRFRSMCDETESHADP